MSNSNDTLDVSHYWNTPAIIRIKYIILQVLQICSFPVYLFVLFHLLTNKTQRKLLNNHVIIVLLLTSFSQMMFDLSFVLTWLQKGVLEPKTPVICYLWNFMDYWAYYGSFMIMLWASLERKFFYRCKIELTLLLRIQKSVSTYENIV